MKERLLDVIREYSYNYNTSNAFQLSLRYLIDNCDDEKRVISILMTEIKEFSVCIEDVLDEEEIEKIENILGK